MSSNKSFSNETSERYALALFGLVKEDSELDKVVNNAKDLLALFNTNNEFKNFIKNPTQSSEIQKNIMQKISNMMKFTKNFTNFLLVLVHKKRIFFLNKIIESFLRLSVREKGKLTGSLISSKILTSEEIIEITDGLSKTIGSSIDFTYNVDESLIGGLKIQLGSLMIDSSIKNKLKKYEKLMLEN